MNSDLNKLHCYPFEKLAALKAGVMPPASLSHIALSIGEPKHAPPEFVLQTLRDNLDGVSKYPSTKGLPALREAIATWASKRFHLAKPLNSETQILPVNGTREALFAFAQTLVDRSNAPLVVMPNPFYQIYEGAAWLAGAEPYFLNCTPATNFIPDFQQVPPEVWNRCQLLYLCSPGNPTGAVISTQQYQTLIKLADTYNFVIASDECYSELYDDENCPPVGLLQACNEMGRNDYARCVVFHSLSKRSNLPGLRSGFVAGDEQLLAKFLLYRTYHGSAMPIPTQMASIAAWGDEQHVQDNRTAYREKFSAVLSILHDSLELSRPTAGFYLWPKTPIPGEAFAKGLFANQNVTVVPGSFLSRNTVHGNPGENYVRMALVATLGECVDAAQRIKAYINTL